MIREDGGGHVVTQGLKEVVVSSRDEMMALIDRGTRCVDTVLAWMLRAVCCLCG